MSSPTISVIIPAYNDERGVELTLESVTGQTYPADDYEVLVVDNNSTDETGVVCRDYAQRYEYVHALEETDTGHRAACHLHDVGGESSTVESALSGQLNE